MRSIRPLFHNRLGPYGMGRQLYVAFRNWPDEERRCQERREQSSPVTIEMRRVGRRGGLPYEEKRQAQRRTHRDPKPEDPERRDTVDGRKAHLPRISAVIAQARERGFLTQKEVNHLHRVFVDSLAESSYQEWLKSHTVGSVFEEPEWDDRDNYEKYALYRFAALIDLFRPKTIEWYTPNQDDMRLVQKLLGVFRHGAKDNTQRAFVRGLFDSGVSLPRLARIPRRGLSERDREIFARHQHLQGKELAAGLDQAGFEGFRKPALEMYDENPDSFKSRIYQLRRKLAR